MRAVIYSTILPAALGLDAIARANGVETVAVIVPRNPISDIDERRKEMRRTLVEEAPEHLDVCLAHDKSSLATLTRAYAPDLVLCGGYPWRIPPEVIAIPPLGIVNGHPSLLPRHRGPYPFAWAIRERDDVLGITYHLMDAEFDTGPILAQASRPFPEDTELEGMVPVLQEITKEALTAALQRLFAGDRGTPQTEDGATWAPAFEDDYREIDWSWPAAEIHRQVRAWRWSFQPDPGPHTTLDGERVHVIRTSLSEPDEKAVVRMEAADGPVWILESAPV